MSLQLRLYQQRLITSIGRSNAIVKLPTGSGKTIVAAALLNSRLNSSNSENGAGLVLVPTQDLVDQQSSVFETWCSDLSIFCFTGGMNDPRFQNVVGPKCLVSTPKAFIHLQRRKPHEFGWHAFSMVVFDEVHHMLKDHPYRHIALDLKNWQNNTHATQEPVQILGFSASLTYSVEPNGIERELRRLCRELQIENMECPSLQELEDGGYVPQYGNNVELERSNEIPEGVVPLVDRKPHLMHATFMKRIRDNEATPFSLKVWKVINRMEEQARIVEPSFRFPLTKTKLSSWEDYAFDMAKQSSYGCEFFTTLETWYTALRLLVQRWEEEEVLVAQWLKMRQAFSSFSCPELEDLQNISANPANFYKLGRLLSHLKEKKEQKGDSFRGIVFVQQRIAAFILSETINTNSEMLTLGFRSGFVAARDSRITPEIKVTKSMAKETIDAFRCNAINVIVATSVIEEGFDVPAANVVISYDHLKNSVELCQRFGRARQQDSSIVVLDERPDRPLQMLETARTAQDSIVNTYNANQARHRFIEDEQEEKIRQQSREDGAFRSTLQDQSKFASNPLLSLNLYVKKTKAFLSEDYSQDGNKHVCNLCYRSVLRTIQVTGSGTSRKNAKKDSGLALLSALRSETARIVS